MLGEVTQRDGEQCVVVLTRIRAQVAVGRCGQLPLPPIGLVDNRTLRPYDLTGRCVRLYRRVGAESRRRTSFWHPQINGRDRPETHGRGET